MHLHKIDVIAIGESLRKFWPEMIYVMKWQQYFFMLLAYNHHLEKNLKQPTLYCQKYWVAPF